jgi:hypothetical protein
MSYPYVVLRTVEAVIGANGTLEPVEPLELTPGQHVLVTVLPAAEAALMAEPALREWLLPEEDAAWSYLNPQQS